MKEATINKINSGLVCNDYLCSDTTHVTISLRNSIASVQTKHNLTVYLAAKLLKHYSMSSKVCMVSTSHTHTHTHPLNGPLSGTTRVSRYQKGKTNLDFTEARDSEWQWHQLSHMQVCTVLQKDNHASTQPLKFLQARCPSCCPTNSVKALMCLHQKVQNPTVGMLVFSLWS